MQSRTKFFLLSIIIAMSLAMGGCRAGVDSPSSIPTPSPSTERSPTIEPTITPEPLQGTVSIWHSFDETQRSLLFRQISAFQTQHPHILFDVQYIPQIDLLPAFQEAIQDGSGPTILIAPAEWGPSLYDQGFVIDISSLVSSSLINSLNPPAVQSGRYMDVLISLPLDIQGVVMYRNQSIVRVSPATFDDMVSLVQSATRGETMGAFMERSFYYSGGHLIGLGGELTTAYGEPAFNQDNYRHAIAWMDLLRAFDRLGPREYNNDQDLEFFKEGRVGLIIDGTWNMQSLVDALGQDTLAIDAWPTYKEGHLSGFVQSENVFLTTRAEGEEKNISWLFAETLFSEEAQLTLADIGLIPAGSGALENHLADKVNVNHPLIAQAMVAMVDGAAYPILPEFGAYTTPIDVALQSVLYKSIDPQIALETAYDSVLATLQSLHPTEEAIPIPTPQP